MKYLYFGAGILAVLLAACIFSTFLISGCTAKTLESLEQALSAFDGGNFPAAAEHADRAKSEWERHSNLLSAMLSHEELDEIESVFSALESYGKTETGDEFRSSCAELALRLRHIRQMDVPFYYNFLVYSIGT